MIENRRGLYSNEPPLKIQHSFCEQMRDEGMEVVNPEHLFSVRRDEGNYITRTYYDLISTTPFQFIPRVELEIKEDASKFMLVEYGEHDSTSKNPPKREMTFYDDVIYYDVARGGFSATLIMTPTGEIYHLGLHTDLEKGTRYEWLILKDGYWESSRRIYPENEPRDVKFSARKIGTPQALTLQVFTNNELDLEFSFPYRADVATIRESVAEDTIMDPVSSAPDLDVWNEVNLAKITGVRFTQHTG